jgi:hypothetical protein
VFDILQAPARSPYALLQPRPRLGDVLGASALRAAARARALPHLDAAFVGLTPAGSLFALSPDRFPLVIFGDAARVYPALGAPAPSASGHAPGDGADDDWEDADGRMLSVDDLKRRREWRARCRGADGRGSMDPRCLIGPRRLGLGARSRLSRLLDGAPPVPTAAELERAAQHAEHAEREQLAIEGRTSWPALPAPSAATEAVGAGSAGRAYTQPPGYRASYAGYLPPAPAGAPGSRR